MIYLRLTHGDGGLAADGDANEMGIDPPILLFLLFSRFNTDSLPGVSSHDSSLCYTH